MSTARRYLRLLLLVFRPARWSVLGFRFMPLVLLAAGVCATVYGVAYHRAAVSETHTEQIMVSVPAPPTSPPMMMPSMPGGPPGMQPFQPPPDFGMQMKQVQATKTVKSTIDLGELAINRAVTVSGIERTPQGELIRVSQPEGPSFCPS